MVVLEAVDEVVVVVVVEAVAVAVLVVVVVGSRQWVVGSSR